MLNHEPGQMDWDRFPIGGSSSNGYINPSNMYDQMTHVGREALAEATRHDEFEPPEVSDNSHAKLFFVFIAIVMAFAFIFTPGHS
ncbi:MULTISPECIES: hypothetical protein [Sphingomonas]|jgi:hypothetical protein|uniref:Uncharacterized protein n=3 Tax=Bacteria TaxID=2 RepID=A0ABU8QAB7_9SPHN|nr:MULTISPECIES: hypothetical protein [Sphingomonas]MBM7407651.1 hypothetical protein [Sphingomonas sp. JUb134]MBM7408064.1 hypothetical protein [Sphingomonas sp. JUb134]MCM3681002.1 hypothetical protein [Sphingomonas paucimobilis]MDF0490809.1 hypothetical protein [Sphingomonas pollutisoli]MDX5986542.1 hypothetical protein [Sphingomonas echinoides]